jgi:hypothetical protein
LKQKITKMGVSQAAKRQQGAMVALNALQAYTPEGRNLPARIDGVRPLRAWGPGVWEAADGTFHVSASELLAFEGWPDTPLERSNCEKILAIVCNQIRPGARVIQIDKPNGNAKATAP